MSKICSNKGPRRFIHQFRFPLGMYWNQVFFLHESLTHILLRLHSMQITQKGSIEADKI